MTEYLSLRSKPFETFYLVVFDTLSVTTAAKIHLYRVRGREVINSFESYEIVDYSFTDHVFATVSSTYARFCKIRSYITC